jgi:hypothetical protein
MRSPLRRLVAAGAVLLFLTGSRSEAQTPTGTVTGVVADATGAAVAKAAIVISSVQTGQTWVVETSAQGIYTAAALPPGEYRVTVEAAGFKHVNRAATVEAGTTTSVDLALELGSVADTVTVRAAVPLLNRDHHQIAGVVHREQIENLPLNGRNILEFAKLEPGVTSPVRGLAGNRTFIATLGAGLQNIPRVGFTRVTVDGASINAFGTIGTSLLVSPEVVHEFQLSTASFDIATGLTTNGAVNVVTRSGGNEYQGTVFGFHRDHHLSAYPGLARDPNNPSPFFERRQVGAAAGGPLRRNRAFFFGSYERVDQHGVASIQPAADFQRLGGVFQAPADGDLFSARIDGRVTPRHALAARFTRDMSASFGPIAGVLPSGWTGQSNDAYQAALAVTSLLPRGIVNEIRWSYFYLDSLPSLPDSTTCAGCFGLDAARITVAGASLAFGRSPNVSRFVGRRSQLSESVVWQRGRHRLRFGADWEHTTTTSTVPDADRVQMTLWSPQGVRTENQLLPPEGRIALPPSFTTLTDILQLPLQTFELVIGPGAAVERDFKPNRTLDMFRVYAADTFRMGRSLTLNGGLAWSYEPNALNHDLTKPPFLSPLLGARGLDAPPARAAFSPAAGFAWATTPEARTIVRGGIGRFFDPVSTANSINLANERLLLSPLGTGRLTITGANIRRNGQPLEFRQRPTPFTGAQLLTSLPGIRAELARSLNPGNRDSTILNIHRTKQGTNLYDPSYDLPSAVHVTVGVQHELARDFVVGADVVWKRFSHTVVNGIDYNRFDSAGGPVIDRCNDADWDNVHAVCSNGPIRFDTSSGRARYTGLLVRAEKRVSGRAQVLASYALGSYVGSNATGTGTAEMGSGRSAGFNNDDWFENYGPMPTDLRHILNVSGFVELPWRFQMAANLSATSRPPFTAWLEDVDINGDGTNDDLLPGAGVNAFGRGLSIPDLERLVDAYNERFAGAELCCGQTAPRVTLPATYAFNDSFLTQDLRVTYRLPLGSAGARLLFFGEVFNVFNTSNLTQYSGNLLQRSTFGRPLARLTQVFGSGGPRAFQLGMRLTF